MKIKKPASKEADFECKTIPQVSVHFCYANGNFLCKFEIFDYKLAWHVRAITSSCCSFVKLMKRTA